MTTSNRKRNKQNNYNAEHYYNISAFQYY